MTDGIGFIVEGDREVALKFDQFPNSLHDRLLGSITRWTTRLGNEVRAATPVRSGKLRSEIETAVFDDKTSITGAVFVAGQQKGDYAKAGAEEYGAHARVKVRTHTQRLDHVFARRLEAPTRVTVEAYTRQANIVATRFLRGPFSGDQAAIEAELRGDTDQQISESGLS